MDPEEDLLSNVNYYHKYLTRDSAEKLLKDKDDGSFLLRKSTKTENYVISVVNKRAFLHYSVNPTHRNGKTMYSVNNGTPFSLPREVCEHYLAMKGGLKCQLLYPIPVISEPLQETYMVETEWYHNEITREEDSMRLSQGYRKFRCNGIFLIRKKDANKYVLSLVNAGRVHRYIIQLDQINGKFNIAGKHKQFSEIQDLVTYHRNNPPSVTGIQCELTVACPKKFDVVPERIIRKVPHNVPKAVIDPKFGVTNPSEEEDTSFSSSPSPNRSPLLQNFNVSSMPEDSPGYNSVYQNYTGSGSNQVARDLYITQDKISIYDEIGKGHFGAVCMARCRIGGGMTLCAIKYLTGDDIRANKKELLSEAAIMQVLDHPNIVRLLAVCNTEANLMMVLELAPLGPFNKFLKGKNENTYSEHKLLNIMRQVCHGMEYLARNNIVHRDLAARNILMVTENFAKVSDFGMSRVLKDSENYYKAVRPGSWPLRWYSPEAMCYYKFTTKCDVWSYGVTLWEAFTYGSRPYKGMKGTEILHMLECNERLDCPLICPPEVYNLMLYCWTYEMEERPTFSQLIPIIENIYSSSVQPALPPRCKAGHSSDFTSSCK